MGQNQEEEVYFRIRNQDFGKKESTSWGPVCALELWCHAWTYEWIYFPLNPNNLHQLKAVFLSLLQGVMITAPVVLCAFLIQITPSGTDEV